MTRKHQLILFLSPSIGVILVAVAFPFIDNASAWSLREAINSTAAWVEDSTRGQEAETPSELLPPSPQTSVSLPERRFADPRAELLGKLAYPQSLSAVESRIGVFDYWQSGQRVYISGYGEIRLNMAGDRVVSYEVTD